MLIPASAKQCSKAQKMRWAERFISWRNHKGNWEGDRKVPPLQRTPAGATFVVIVRAGAVVWMGGDPCGRPSAQNSSRIIHVLQSMLSYLLQRHPQMLQRRIPTRTHNPHLLPSQFLVHTIRACQSRRTRALG